MNLTPGGSSDLLVFLKKSEATENVFIAIHLFYYNKNFCIFSNFDILLIASYNEVEFDNVLFL